MNRIMPFGSKPFVDEKEMEFVEVEVKEFPASAEMDVSYSTYLVAGDDRLYLGTCRQGGSAHLLAYDPKQDKILDLANMDEVIPDFSRGYARHGKVHTPLCEGDDGKIYGATHMDISFPFWSSFYDPHGYAGGHWFCYDPKSNTCTDLGLAISKEGILTMAMDKKRQILYGISWPRGYLLSYDIRTGITKNRGRASVFLSRFILCMSDGTVFFTGRNGHIATYHPDNEFVENLPIRLEREEAPDSQTFGQDIVFTTPLEWKPNGNFFAFILSEGIMTKYARGFFKYDLVDKTVKYYNFFDRGIYVNAQMVIASDKKIYYALPANAGASGPNRCGRIFRFSPETETNELVGYMRSRGNTYQLSHLSGGAIGLNDTMYWFALTPRDTKAGYMTFEQFYGCTGFRATKPVLIIYKPAKEN